MIIDSASTRPDMIQWTLYDHQTHSRGLLQSLAFPLAGDTLPPVRAITRGPKFHWFAYYDKLQFDPTGRYVLGMEVDFQHRSPRPDDVIRMGMVRPQGQRPLD